jgi:hypothetical protein
MRLYGLSLLLILLISAGNTSFARQSLLMGKIVDENNKPIHGAIIKVTKARKTIEVRSDNDGLYYTQLLATDSYRIGVHANGKYLKAKKIYFIADEPKKYYILRLKENKLEVEVTDKNVFMDTQISKIEANQNLHDMPKDGWRIKKDGSIDRVYYGEHIPQMKEIK